MIAYHLPSFPKRHPDNSNLTIWYDSHYRGLPLMVEKGPFITEYLEKLWQTIQRARWFYSRVYAARIDLKFPVGYDMPEEFVHNTVLSRFIESFKDQIKKDQARSARKGRRVHPTELFYFWVREVSSARQPHYHFAFMLNGNAYHTLGKLKARKRRVNLFHRLQWAWAKALGPSIDASGLVNVPENAEFSLGMGVNDPGVVAFFHRTSYFCKAATKVYFGRTRNCGCSRI